jgi:hypothetical protein
MEVMFLRGFVVSPVRRHRVPPVGQYKWSHMGQAARNKEFAYRYAGATLKRAP